MRPKTILVRVSGNLGERLFLVTVPFEYKAEICTYLSRHLDIHHPVNTHPLILTSRDASRLVEVVLKRDDGQSTAPDDVQVLDFIARS